MINAGNYNRRMCKYFRTFMKVVIWFHSFYIKECAKCKLIQFNIKLLLNKCVAILFRLTVFSMKVMFKKVFTQLLSHTYACNCYHFTIYYTIT
jgi:hypothetical protein